MSTKVEAFQCGLCGHVYETEAMADRCEDLCRFRDAEAQIKAARLLVVAQGLVDRAVAQCRRTGIVASLFGAGHLGAARRELDAAIAAVGWLGLSGPEATSVRDRVWQGLGLGKAAPMASARDNNETSAR